MPSHRTTTRAAAATLAALTALLAACSAGPTAVTAASADDPEPEVADDEVPAIRDDVDHRGGPDLDDDRTLSALNLHVPDDAETLTLERGRWIATTGADDGGWTLSAIDPVTGRTIYNTALPAWLEDEPTLAYGQQRAYLYTDRPNPDLTDTHGVFDPDDVPSRIQQLDAYDLTTGAHLWTAGPLHPERHPEQIPDRIRHLDGVIIAGEWGIHPDGTIAWTDPELSDLLFDGRAAHHLAPHHLADLGTEELTVYDLTTGQRTAAASRTGTFAGATPTHLILDANRGYDIYDRDTLDRAARVEWDALGLGTGAAVSLHAAASRPDGELELVVSDNEQAVQALIAGDGPPRREPLHPDARVREADGWLLSLEQPSQAETVLGATSPDGRKFDFQVTYSYGQSGTPDATIAEDGLLYLAAGDKLFVIDPDAAQLLAEVELPAPVETLAHVDGGLVVIEDQQDRHIGVR